MNNVNIQNFFSIEKLRDSLAKENRDEDFLKTYQGKDFIKDKNSNRFWNKKLITDQQLLYKSPIYGHKIEIVLNHLERQKGSVLDVGFGVGYLELRLQEKNKLVKIYGIDKSSQSVLLAKKQVYGKFKVGDVNRIPFRKSSMDCVIALDVLEHIQPSIIFNVLYEINRVMKHRAQLIISIPINENLKGYLVRGKNPNRHVRDYTLDIVKKELSLSGFICKNHQTLYAFAKNYYIKSFLVKLLPFLFHKKPNLIVLFAIKK